MQRTEQPGVPAGDLHAESWWIREPEFLSAKQSEWPIDDVPASSCPAADEEFKKKLLRVQLPERPALLTLPPTPDGLDCSVSQHGQCVSFIMCANHKNNDQVS